MSAFLNAEEMTIVAALAEAVIAAPPAGPAPAVPAAEVAANVNRYLGSFSSSRRDLIHLVLHSVEWAPLPFEGERLSHREEDLVLIDQTIQASEDIALTSAHPQGGNTLDTRAGQGVVGADFRVHGMDNLYIADASLFPTSVVVNPQLTVMAMADLAAESVQGHLS
jgi:choline dehydrogenase-like flavoprotein